MNSQTMIRKSLISVMAASAATFGFIGIGAAPASAAGGATCPNPEIVDNGHAAKHSCKITGGSVELMYTFKCYGIPPVQKNKAVTWSSSGTKTIKNPCVGSSAYAVSYKIA